MNGYFCMTVADTQRKNEKVSFIEWLYDIFKNIQNIIITISHNNINISTHKKSMNAVAPTKSHTIIKAISKHKSFKP